MASKIHFLLTVVCLFSMENSLKAARPNILLIMVDDMGYGDPGCYNPESKIPTPNIDRLAKEGMKFTDAHAPAAVCVPTRYGLMTGSYPFRMKSGGGRPLIEKNSTTIATLLHNQGYHTGMVGKWHLGVEQEKNPPANTHLPGGPFDHGFSSYFGIPASLDIPPYYYIENDKAVAPPSNEIGDSNSEGWTKIQGAFWRKGGIAPGYKHEEVTPTFIEKSVAWLKDHQTKSAEKPFFLYVAFPSPHTPWLPLKQFQGKSGAGMYGDFVMQVDHSVGQILDTLDELKQTEKTLVFFTSDNGPVWYAADEKRLGHKSTGGLRGMKGDAWEGGHRMPFLARWPAKIQPGSTSDEVICHVDFLATFAEILATKLPENAGVDSHSFLPALLDQKREGSLREATIHQSSRRVLAIRQGNWKLIPELGSGGFSKPSRREPEKGEPKGQLYNLKVDRAEQKNLYDKHPEKVEALSKLLKKYQQQGHSR